MLKPILKYYSSICLNTLSKNHRKSQNILCSGHDAKQTPPEYKSEGSSFSPLALSHDTLMLLKCMHKQQLNKQTH